MRHLGLLSTDELLGRVIDLVHRDQEITADLIDCLAEIDRRHAHLDRGSSSLHAFCTEHLGFSDDVAYKRIRAARVAQRHPEVIERLCTGKLTLSSLVAIGPHLDERIHPVGNV
jgi:hypothetical protein